MTVLVTVPLIKGDEGTRKSRQSRLNTHIGMPVELTQSARLERNKRGGDSLTDGEVGRVDLVKGTARPVNLLGLMLEGAVDKGGVVVNVNVGGGAAGDLLVGLVAVDNVGRGLGHVVKHLFVHAKVLGEDVLGSVRDPVVNVEGGSE